MAYSPEQRAEIIQRLCLSIVAGKSVSEACRCDGMPNRDTIFQWLAHHPELSDQYMRARKSRADARSDRIDEICRAVQEKTMAPDVARVIIDAEKWQAGKENAKRYGDKTALVGGDDDDNPIRQTVSLDADEFTRRIAVLSSRSRESAASGDPQS